MTTFLIAKVNHFKSFIHGQPPASWKIFRIYHVNFDNHQKKNTKNIKNHLFGRNNRFS